MNNIDSLLKEIKEEIHSEPIIQEYLKLKQIVDNDEEIKLINKQLKELQKIMTQNFADDALYLPAKEKYDELNARLDANPSLQNFKSLEEEVYAFLLQIRRELQ